MSNKIGAVSFFCGGGGLDCASVMAGVPLIASTDFVEDCVETLKANEDFLGKHDVILGDISQMPASVFKESIDKAGVDKFIIIGGPPCQPFSTAGNVKDNSLYRGTRY